MKVCILDKMRCEAAVEMCLADTNRQQGAHQDEEMIIISISSVLAFLVLVELARFIWTCCLGKQTPFPLDR